jgi:hypothetical protein
MVGVSSSADILSSFFLLQLPDGNVDDLSQHSSEPVESGEKVRGAGAGPV